jgi:hypothetical protein
MIKNSAQRLMPGVARRLLLGHAVTGTLLQPIPEVLVHQPLALKERSDDGGVFIDLVIVAQQRQALLHAGHSALQCGIGVEHKAIAQLAQFVGVEDGGLAADDHIHELGSLQALRQGAHFFGLGDGLDKQDVGAGFLKLLGTLDGGFKPWTAAASVRAMMRVPLSRRASTAALILPSISLVSITALPLKWPQRLGLTWSSS